MGDLIRQTSRVFKRRKTPHPKSLVKDLDATNKCSFEDLDATDKTDKTYVMDIENNVFRVRMVTFRDLARKLSSRHVITEIHHRPLTSEDEKKNLFYSVEDINLFE